MCILRFHCTGRQGHLFFFLFNCHIFILVLFDILKVLKRKVGSEILRERKLIVFEAQQTGPRLVFLILVNWPSDLSGSSTWPCHV